ncbi:MAG: glycosyltransferase family 2 protein [Phycisphaeraceae bacterium]
MRLLIVIVNYKTAGLTVDCLASLEAQVDPSRDRVVVIDNASGDGSHEAIRDAIEGRGWSSWALAEETPGNDGFAAGNNFGIEVGRSQWGRFESTLLLNPDTVVRPGALSTMLGFMADHPDAALLGSRLEHLDGTPQESAFRFPSIFSCFEEGVRFGPISRLLRGRIVAMPVAEAPHRAEWLCGASLMIRDDVFERIGLLDDQYFMYFEETDFCLAARRAGFEAWYVPEARIVHLVGKSSGVTSKHDGDGPARRRPAYWFESRRRYFVKNHGRVGAMLADAAWIVGFGLHRLRQRLMRRPDRDPQHLLADSIRQSVFCRGFKV